MRTLECIKQHSRDRRLEFRVGFARSELWGLTPDEKERDEIASAVGENMAADIYSPHESNHTFEARKYPQATAYHVEPHPGYIADESPRYWICAL